MKLRKKLSHQKNPHEQCIFATKAGTGFHSFYTFFKKVLEHFWKVWYIIAILVRIEPETPVRKIFFLFLKGVIHYDDACKFLCCV